MLRFARALEIVEIARRMSGKRRALRVGHACKINEIQLSSTQTETGRKRGEKEQRRGEKKKNGKWTKGKEEGEQTEAGGKKSQQTPWPGLTKEKGG